MLRAIRQSGFLGSSLLLILAAGCGSGSEPIIIGLAGALTDPVGGGTMLRAARMAVNEINAGGGVRGRPLQLEPHDDWGLTDSAVAVAERIVSGKAVAVIGHAYSRNTMAAAPVYSGAAVPIAAITPSSSSPEISEAGDWVFRTCPTDLSHGAALARWAREGLGFVRGAVLYINDEYGRGIRRAFVHRFEGQGGEILEQDPFLDDPPDMRPFLERLQQDGRVEFLMIAGNRTQAFGVLRQARDLGLTVPILGGDGLQGIEGQGGLAAGTYISSAYLPAIATPANRRFVERYRTLYPDDGDPNQPAAATYDIVYLLARTIEEAGTSRSAIRAALSAVGTTTPAYRGVTGAIGFDSMGDLLGQQVWISIVRDGAMHLAEEQ